jgi:hypothetical protein
VHARVYDNLVRAADVTPTTFADLVTYLVTLKVNEAVCESAPAFEVVHTLSRAWVLIHIPSPASGQWMRPVRMPLRTLFPQTDAGACGAPAQPHWAWPLVAAAFLFTDRFAYGLHAQTASPVHMAYQFLRQAAVGAMPVDVQYGSTIEDLARDLGARAVVKHASAIHAEIYCLVPNASACAGVEPAQDSSAQSEGEEESRCDDVDGTGHTESPHEDAVILRENQAKVEAARVDAAATDTAATVVHNVVRADVATAHAHAPSTPAPVALSCLHRSPSAQVVSVPAVAETPEDCIDFSLYDPAVDDVHDVLE